LGTLIAVACAVAASLAFNYAMYMQKKAVGTLPEVKMQLSWQVLKAFLTNRRWVASMIVVLGGSVLYAIALTMAPISIVQPIMASGVALLAYLAVKNLGEEPRRIDLVAIGLSILGVILIGVSLAEGLPKNVKHSPGSLWIFTAALIVVAVIVPLAAARGSNARLAAAMGISVGMMYGLSAVFAKLMLEDWGSRWPHQGMVALFSSIFLIAWAVTLVPSFILLQSAFQKGMAIVVVPLMASLSQLVPIAVGMVALHETFPRSIALSVIRIIAFGLILVATVILSRRAESVTAPSEREPAFDTELELET